MSAAADGWRRGLTFAALVLLAAVPARAQLVSCPAQQDSLITIPEITSANGRLRATLKLVDGVRTMWGATDDPRCARQNIRYLAGTLPAGGPPWPVTSEPIPGPTFRARLGDLVEISFFNQVNTANFAASLDRGDVGTLASCDQFTKTDRSGTGSRTGSAGGDRMPNCLHGSSTTNVHFHGTHTTPATTGDNVLLFIRPALRTGGRLRPGDETLALRQFQSVFSQCERTGPIPQWGMMPQPWRDAQRAMLKSYDDDAVYQGQRGALPAGARLWPADSVQIATGLWPQYQLGAYAYCFPLPAYDSTTMRMGQSPGTHWYHAHKHGSTALNVANALTGALIITGPYDDALRAYYGPGLRERVLMLQQLGTTPFPLTNPNTRGPASVGRPPISINGRLDPVVGMRPGEVQLWRIINGAFRDAVQLAFFKPQSSIPCSRSSAPATPAVQWRQIAQDGVQFDVRSYPSQGAVNRQFNLAPANRGDILVSAPATPGLYTLCVVLNSALFVQDTGMVNGAPDPASTLLTVSVGGAPVTPAQDFIPAARFPVQPAFLADIPDSAIRLRRTITFGSDHKSIDGRSFQDHHVDQAMLLNTAEEWTVQNLATDKSHPFHIHINPFQITAEFQPNSPAARDPSNPCYVNPNDPATFKPCPAQQPTAPYIWWDTFAIPSAQQWDISKQCGWSASDSTRTLAVGNCPAPLRPYTSCVGPQCTETIPGWFRLRSRFVDWPGQFVLHCHILIHEDRGMMQLIEVVPDQIGYSHH